MGQGWDFKGLSFDRLMSLKKGERLIIPLLGNKKIEGNISVILSKTSCVIHQSEVKYGIE